MQKLPLESFDSVKKDDRTNLEIQVSVPTVPDASNNSNFETLILRFLNAQDVRENSKSTYRRGIRQFSQWIQETNRINLTREDILAFKLALGERKLSALTISNYLVAVRKFFEWAEGMKIYPNVSKGIKGSKKLRGFKKDVLTVEQIQELLSSINLQSIEGKRNFALINLLVRTGIRTIEAIRADVGDLRQEGGEAKLWLQGKGRDSKEDFSVLTYPALKPLQEYLALRENISDNSPLFASTSDRNREGRLTTRSISRIVKEALRAIGIDNKRLTAHSIRHTAITLALMGGSSLQEVQAFARHTNLNTTLIYAHNMNRMENAAERKIEAVLAQGMAVNSELQT